MLILLHCANQAGLACKHGWQRMANKEATMNLSRPIKREEWVNVMASRAAC